MKMKPKTAQVMVNKKCNSHCSFCSIWKNQDLEEPSLDDYKKLVKMGVKEINLTGGEPFLSDIMSILDYLKNKARVVISTNGFLTNKIIAIMTKYKGYPNIAVRVSLDGITETHDKIRGTPGAFVNATNTIMALKKLGIKDLGISFTICKDNLKEVYDAYELSKLYGVQFVVTTAFDSKHYFNTEETNVVSDYENVAYQLETIQKEYLAGWNIKNWGRAFFLEFVKQHTLGKPIHFKCNALSDFFFVNNKSTILPCVVLNNPLGQIKDIESLWTSEWAARIRNDVANCRKDCLMCNFTSYIKEHKYDVLKWCLDKKFNFKEGLCKIGLHRWQTRIRAYYTHGEGCCGEVQKCSRCLAVRATGKANIPDFMRGED